MKTIWLINFFSLIEKSWLRIWCTSRLHWKPKWAVRQNLHPIRQPDWTDMQSVCLLPSGRYTASNLFPSSVWKLYLTLPSMETIRSEYRQFPGHNFHWACSGFQVKHHPFRGNCWLLFDRSISISSMLQMKEHPLNRNCLKFKQTHAQERNFHNEIFPNGYIDGRITGLFAFAIHQYY